MKLKGILLTGVAMAVAVSAAFSLAATSATTPSGPIAFGMESSSIAAQAAAGVKPDYGTFWIGPWTLTSGWGGPDGSLASMNSQGVTPALHFYYWGDDISPSCVENGCWSTLHNTQKDRAHWQVLAQQMVDHLNAGMAGKPVVVFLESEFNKGGIETYEPFDGYMADMAAFIHAGYPQAHIVLGFGNWGSQYWGNFDRAAAASDLVGIQGMRGSTRQTATQMMTLYDGLLAGVKTLETTFPGKGIMLTDIAVSSYPEPDYLQVQADVLKEVFDNLETLKSHGVQAMIYRSWKDSPTMSTANYYGEAERHWGVVHASDGSFKPAAQVWIDGVKAQRTGATLPPPPPPPAPAPVTAADGVAVQVESFLTKTAGGKQADAAAAGGSMWNLWSNGAVTQSFNASSPVDMTFRVRGTTLAGVGPHMDVYVAGAKVLSADPGTSYTDVQVPLPAGPATDVRIAFTNDAASSSEDRNLVLDQVSFAAPPPPNQPPLAALAASATGLTVTADASGSSDPDGDALTYAIDFGDGATASTVLASHAYAAPGPYTVTVTVSDGKASASASQAIDLVKPNAAPSAAFTAAASGLSLALDASASSDPDGDALTYTWAFGDGAAGTGLAASHTYATAGTFTVSLVVSDGQASATTAKAVTVVQPNRAPLAAFTASTSSLKATVDASGSSDPDGNALTYAWSFGDGSSATGKTASHTYARAGTYTVVLKVSDGTLSAQASRTVTVQAFTATFAPKAVGNNWWVETAVTANQAIAKVEARINGGAWVQLPKDSWGTYAKSLNAPDGSHVVFRATNASGASVTSATYTWT